MGAFMLDKIPPAWAGAALVVGIVGIVTLDSVALLTGHDGNLFIASLLAIGAIMGVAIPITIFYKRD